MTGPITITAGAVLDLAQSLLDEVVVSLGSTVGGTPELTYLHPGDMVPDYLYVSNCESASVRITSIAPDRGSTPQMVSGWTVVCEVKVTRCYGEAADPALNPEPQVLTELTRVQQEDADAVRRALCALPDRPRWQAGPWVPRGAQGGVFSGLTTVTFTGVDASCCT